MEKIMYRVIYYSNWKEKGFITFDYNEAITFQNKTLWRLEVI
jgi:hypothetical protein